jgi:hypothetical protein
MALAVFAGANHHVTLVEWAVVRQAARLAETAIIHSFPICRPFRRSSQGAFLKELHYEAA